MVWTEVLSDVEVTMVVVVGPWVLLVPQGLSLAQRVVTVPEETTGS